MNRKNRRAQAALERQMAVASQMTTALGQQIAAAEDIQAQAKRRVATLAADMEVIAPGKR